MGKKLTLLDKAKTIPVGKRNMSSKYTEEDADLVEAWARDEIGLIQLSVVKGFKKTDTSTIYSYIAFVFREIYRANK